MPERMGVTLQGRVARALRDRWDEQPVPDVRSDRLAEKLALADADAALAALGLDDLDAAVERGASALRTIYGFRDEQGAPGARSIARVVLKAALTSSPSEHRGGADGQGDSGGARTPEPSTCGYCRGVGSIGHYGSGAAGMLAEVRPCPRCSATPESENTDGS